MWRMNLEVSCEWKAFVIQGAGSIEIIPNNSRERRSYICIYPQVSRSTF